MYVHMFNIVDTTFSYRRALIVCWFLQDFPRLKRFYSVGQSWPVSKLPISLHQCFSMSKFLSNSFVYFTYSKDFKCNFSKFEISIVPSYVFVLLVLSYSHIGANTIGLQYVSLARSFLKIWPHDSYCTKIEDDTFR